MTSPCEVRRLHLVTYENGMNMQETLVSMRQQERIPDQLLLLEHTPVITLGRGGDHANLLASQEVLGKAGLRFYETTRGGDITYHGPGQLVGYPILHMGEGSRDVRKYVTKLEELLIRTLACFGIKAERVDGQRGVWVGKEKVAAIGVRIARWITSHGFALNVHTNLDHFRLITPCGIHGADVTSMEKLLGRSPDLDEVAAVLLRQFADLFERELRVREDRLDVVSVVASDGERVLLLHRREGRGGYWQPVTGRRKPDEDWEQAARRELLEETGSRAGVMPLGLRQSFLIEPKYLKDLTEPVFADEVSYGAFLEPGNAIRLDPEEHDAWRWFSFEEAVEKVHWSDDRESIERMRCVILSPFDSLRSLRAGSARDDTKP